MDGVTTGFADTWFWLIFVGVGLFLILLELIIGIDTGLDLVFIGSAFIIGGLVTWPFGSWILSLIIVAIICVAYVFIGRRYVHRWTAVKQERTNIDAIIGKRGIVLENIARNADGRVRVGNERWRARSDVEIGEGEEIIVTAVSGTALIVEKAEGGNS
jgi:membrane protein implicated in regulation of membrane protease activity